MNSKTNTQPLEAISVSNMADENTVADVAENAVDSGVADAQVHSSQKVTEPQSNGNGASQPEANLQPSVAFLSLTDAIAKILEACGVE